MGMDKITPMELDTPLITSMDTKAELRSWLVSRLRLYRY
jgi:hypothetical protein